MTTLDSDAPLVASFGMPAFGPPPSREEPLRLAPAPDGAAGARVRLPPGTVRAVITGHGLAAVDVEGDGALAELDLSACAPGLFVTLQGTTSLQRLVVPPSGRGAVLFLMLGTLRPALRVEGAVRCVDVSCSGGQGRPASFQVDGGDEVFANAWLGASGEDPAPDAGVVALCGGSVDGQWLARAAAARAVVISRCEAPGGLSTPCALRTLVLSEVRTPSLAYQATGHVRIERCNSLASITGNAGRLVIRGGVSVKELVISGHVLEADLGDVGCSVLRIPSAGALLLQGGNQIRELHTLASGEMILDVRGGHSPRVFGQKGITVRPLTPADIEREFLHGTETGREGMLAWARGCKKAGELWLALQVLTTAIDTGLPPSHAWAYRCALMGQGQGARAWVWGFPDDLAIRGWSADVRLWLRCVAAELPEAVQYARVMCNARAPANFAALVVVAASRDMEDSERALLCSVALRVLEHGTRDGERLDMKRRADGTRFRAGISAVNADWLHQAFRALLELSALPVSLELADAWSLWLAARAPITEGVEILGSLAAHGCKQAEDQLVALQQQLPSRTDLNRAARTALGRMLALQLLQPPRLPRWGGSNGGTP